MILGLDPALSCGWALLDEDGQRVASGAWDLAPRGRWEGGGMPLLRLRAALLELLTAHPVRAIAYEEVRRHMSTDSAHSYGEIVGVVKLVGDGKRVPFTSIPVGTIKSRATGKGNAGKPEMIAAALTRWGVACETDDEADALWCAECLRVELGAA